jgi:hypothetical protein
VLAVMVFSIFNFVFNDHLPFPNGPEVGGMAKFAPKSFVTRLVEINGEPGFVSYFNGKPAIALVLHIADDNIETIFAISNPAKLAHLPGAPS